MEALANINSVPSLLICRCVSNMQFPTDPPRSTICYGDDVQGIYQQRSWLTRCRRVRYFSPPVTKSPCCHCDARVRSSKTLLSRYKYYSVLKTASFWVKKRHTGASCINSHAKVNGNLHLTTFNQFALHSVIRLRHNTIHILYTRFLLWILTAYLRHWIIFQEIVIESVNTRARMSICVAFGRIFTTGSSPPALPLSSFISLFLFLTASFSQGKFEEILTGISRFASLWRMRFQFYDTHTRSRRAKSLPQNLTSAVPRSDAIPTMKSSLFYCLGTVQWPLMG